MQHSLKLGGTNYHFKWVKVPGTTTYWKAWIKCTDCLLYSDIFIFSEWCKLMPTQLAQINLKDQQFTMGTYRTQMLWENIRKGDLSASAQLLQNGNINLEERDEV